MSNICPNKGLRVRLRSSVKLKALARNIITPTLKMSDAFKLKARASVIFRGFPRGSGETNTSTFGANLFGLNPNDPSIYVRPARTSGSIRINSTKIFIRRCPPDLPNTIWVGFNDPNYISYGNSAIPESIFTNVSSNTHVAAHSAGPKIFHSLATEKRRHDNFKFTARASVPVNNLKGRFSVSAKVKSKFFEKLSGYFDQINKIDNYVGTDKLYPIRDVQISNNGISFITENLETSGIYRSIDEGVVVGNITQNGMAGSLICDDDDTFITPSSIYTEGKFFYECEVTPPSITPLETFLFIRASAPIKNYESEIPPVYNIRNIRFQDPSGNLIAKYKDLKINGEQDYDLKDQHHFVTYVTEPETNNAKLKTWQQNYPVLGEPSGYTLSMEIEGNCFYHAFEKDRFNKGFQEGCNFDDKFVESSLSDHLALDGTPLSTITNGYQLKPADALRISAIELNNRGLDGGILRDSQIPLFLEVVPKGNRLLRTIYPTKVMPTNFDNDVHPTGGEYLWKTSPDIRGNVFYNSDNDNKSVFELQDRLNNIYIDGHITLESASPIPHSGKLQLLYEHKTPFTIKEPRGGAFNFGNKYTNGFDRSSIEKVIADDSFFVVEDITLRIEARKAPNTPDFPIDVVGYSDDGLLISTRQVGGFLQNKIIGEGDVPRASGYIQINEPAISSNPLSRKESYYDNPVTSNEAGDHYKIDDSVMVNSTEFKFYDIPLKIYKEAVTLGQSPDYTMSTYFESLYLDIYPIPTGASIANAGLVVKYQPAGALKMSTLGSLPDKQIATRKNTLTPVAKKIVDKPHHASISSLIENIPHGYETRENTLKTNYSRRWRGSSGSISAGPFESDTFGFGFSFPQLDTPFILGRFDFSSIDGQTLNNINGGLITGTFSNVDTANSVISSIASRFQSNHLFDNPIRPYRTLDWVPTGDVLENRIIDAFDYAVRVSGVDGHINFGDTPTSEGFSLFMRFSPDVTMSGVGYSLWDTGVLFQKQDSGQDLEYGLRYNNGKLEGFAREDSTGNTIVVSDTVDFYDYQYPLSVLLTYNAGNNQKLKLYTENEIASSWSRLRGESQEFVMNSGTSDLTFGYSKESGLGINAFITEIGLSSVHPSGGANIVDATPNSDYQQDTVDLFFSSHSVSFLEGLDQNPLWKFVDENTDDWHLGAFKYCSFGNDYDIMKTRIGKDYIYHTYHHDGLTYKDRININLPETLSHASGLAYHSQIENDMVRFNLSGREDRFYAITPRIQKDIPRSYITEDDALQVNTVIQHESFGDVIWEDGSKGPKIIVSLYTPAKESDLLPTKNYGLISRSSHNVSSDDCWTKLASMFTLSDIKDRTSEPWSYFEQSITKQELKENYFAREIDEMFIQYDLVYPSGSYQRSDIIIHSLDVSLHGALQQEVLLSDDLVLYSSGEAYQEAQFDLYTDAYGEGFSENLPLYSSGIAFKPTSGELHLMSSGIYQEVNNLNLYSITVGTWPPPPISDFGSSAPIVEDANFGLHTSQEGDVDPFRDHVKLLLPFDNNLDDISLNNYGSPTILPLDFDNGQFAEIDLQFSVNTTNRVFPTLSDETPFDLIPKSKNGRSADFGGKYINNNWHVPHIKYDNAQWNVDEADGDWMIDFWYYLYDTGTMTGYPQPKGAWRVLTGYWQTIFDWSEKQFAYAFDQSYTQSGKRIGIKLGWANGVPYLEFGLNSYGEVTNLADRFGIIPDDHPQSGWVLNENGDRLYFSQWDESVNLSLYKPQELTICQDLHGYSQEFLEFNEAQLGNSRYYDKNNGCYNTAYQASFSCGMGVKFRGYEDIRNKWSKWIVRKIGNYIQVFIDEELVGETCIGRLKFDRPENVPNWELPPPNNFPLKIFGNEFHGFYMDDFRITMGSARSSDRSVNPTISSDAESNGLSISSPAPVPDPNIQPTTTTTTTTTLPPLSDEYVRMVTFGSFDFEADTVNLSVESFNPELQSTFNQLNLIQPDPSKGTGVDKSIYLYAYSELAISDYQITTPTNLYNDINLYTLGPNKTFVSTSTNINLILDARSPEININNDLDLYLLHRKPFGKFGDQLEAFTWDSDNIGLAIDVLDNSFSTLPANDELRGVNTICYGGCEKALALSCLELEVNTHDTLWYAPECVDGGVIRGFRTYTNPDVNAFGQDYPYDKHYYGIRKFEGLIPQAPYNIKITGKTGTDEILEVPRELKEWEYGTKNSSTGDSNKNIDYSGIKIIAPQNSIEEKQKFAKSLTVLKDMVILGCPFENSEVGVNDTLNPTAYPPSYELNDNGKIYVYKKHPEPQGSDWTNQSDKSPYSLDQEIVLPTGFRRDDFYETIQEFKDDEGNTLDFNAVVRNWVNIGEGRQLGHSLDSTSTDDRDIIVAGGPGSIWSRQFAPVSTTPVRIGLFVFSNEVITNPPDKSWEYIKEELKNRDILYRYFADPPVAFDIKIIILEPLLGSETSFTSSEDFDFPVPDFVKKYVTNRHYNFDYNSQEYKDQEAVILQELKDIFHAEFPIDESLIHNGLPPLFGCYIDNSRSLGPNPLGYFDNDLRSGALNKFLEYYKEYTLQNGVEYYNGTPSEGGVQVILNTDEDWIAQSLASIQSITDIDRLRSTGDSQLIADNLGTFQSNASEFNIPPPSGGAVFIFEKKEGRPFEIIQAIDSPVDYNNDVSDRFGHDVSISDDGNIIVIGSPYSEYAVQIWEYDPYYNEILTDYITSNVLDVFLNKYSDIERDNGTFGEAYSVYEDYKNAFNTTSSVKNLRIETYNSFSESLKFVFLRENDIQAYYLIKSLNYNGVYSDLGGSWSRLYGKFIPTARLGYSVDTNSDGSLVAVGCPTDSFGERDASVTWFRYERDGTRNFHWQNYTNAGAVRLFESRNFYPHDNKVVEYYKFGNLHELLSPEDDANFFEPALQSMFNSAGLNYSRTSFSEDKKIPQDAGMAMIITPAIDAASKEIIDNIKEWLAYGDRHLVLVGNDPKWEANGAYQQSNNIINLILSELNIKLRIYPARNSYDALVDDTNIYLNVQKSFVPAKTTTPYGEAQSLRGYGVGDIRFYDPGRSDIYNCQLPPGTRVTVDGEVVTDTSDPFAILEQIDGQSADSAGRKLTYRELHDRCELPIIHEGDIRAKYEDQCVYRNCKGETTFNNFQHNLAYMYGTHTECNDWKCTVCDEVCPPVLSANKRDNSEPIPIMAAYESVKQTIFVPAVPEEEFDERRQVGTDTKSNIRKGFGDIPYSGIDFLWSAEENNYTSLEMNINNINSTSLFYDPEEYNGKDAILQAQASLPIELVEREYNYTAHACYIAEAKFITPSLKTADLSSVFLIAGTLTENREILLSSDGDKNLNLYFNILAKDSLGSSRVALLGGFTNRVSFQDAYVDSDIEMQMTSLGINFDKNVKVKDLNDVSKGYDVAWIANTNQYPSQDDIDNIKTFLSSGNKKVIITYGQEPNIDRDNSPSNLDEYMILAANVAEDICKRLGLGMKPMFLPGKNKIAEREDIKKFQGYGIVLNENHFVTRGFDADSRMISADGDEPINFTINLPPFGRDGKGVGYYHQFIPIDVNGAIPVAYFEPPVQDLKTISQGVPAFHTGITKVSFKIPEPREDVPETDDNNMFRLFFDIVSESANEEAPLWFAVSNASKTPFANGVNLKISDTSEDGTVRQTLVENGTKFKNYGPRPFELDLQLGDTDELEIFIFNDTTYLKQDNPTEKFTHRLLSISGVRIPMATETNVVNIPIWENFVKIRPAVDAYSYEIDVIRQISTHSDKYCLEANSDVCAEQHPVGYGSGIQSPAIADGPVVVAQEIYHQAGYFNGHNKSRVTVISDPSLIQGKTILTEDQEKVNQDVAYFLQSLYPQIFNDLEIDMIGSGRGASDDFWHIGRTYESTFKIISPERSSPSRLINAYPENSGLNYRFGKYESNELPLTDYSDDEGKKQILPVPPKNFVSPPFDGMLDLMKADDPGKFRKLPDAPRVTPGERFSNMKPPEAGVAAKKAYEQKWYHDEFVKVEEKYSSTTKLLDTYNGITYEDAGISERIPQLMRETGIDHLDFKVFNSGYPGDLFGYKVYLHKDKLYVGSPFATYTQEDEIVTWQDVVEKSTTGIYGTELGFNGGAGSVYVVERTGVVGEGKGTANYSREITTGIPWEVTGKFRPDEISVGYPSLTAVEASGIFGDHNYTDEFLSNNAHVSDMFGYNIALEGDILAISAPAHNFETHFEKTSAEFMRKEFNEQFDITQVTSHDLAIADNRTLFPGSGSVVINNGAVFTYENKISDWGQKIQSWTQIHKLIPQGYNSRVQGSGENTYFGESLGLYRSRRNDADYILAAGAESHSYPMTDGSRLQDAGAAWAFDGMLRKLRPAFSHPDTYISGRIYGEYESEKNYTKFNFSNGTAYDKKVIYEGRVLSTINGEIFIEASGQDAIDKGYVVHRPYIDKIEGRYAFGVMTDAILPIVTQGDNPPLSGVMNLFSQAPDQGNVYNNVDLYTYNAIRNSGELHLQTSGALFGQGTFGSDFYEDTESAKDIQDTIFKATNISFLVSRGGF